MYISRLLLAPELRHILEALALGLRHELEDKHGGYDADHAIETIREPMAEVVAGGEVHIEHRHESGADYEVEHPLEGHGDSHRRTADGVREEFGDKHPCYRTP